MKRSSNAENSHPAYRGHGHTVSGLPEYITASLLLLTLHCILLHFAVQEHCIRVILRYDWRRAYITAKIPTDQTEAHTAQCAQMIHLSFARTESYCIDKTLSNKTEKCPPVAEILLNPVGLLLVSVIVSHCGCSLLSARVRSNKWSSDFLHRQASCSREIHPL